MCVRVCMRLLCLNHIETTTNKEATHHKWLAEGKRMRRSNSKMYTPHNTSAIQTHIQNICGNFMENSKRVHSIFHSRSLFFRSPRNPSHHPYSLIYSFIPFQSVNGKHVRITLSRFLDDFPKNRHFIFTSVCVCECALCMPSNIQRDEKERQRTNCGMGCIRTYALYHRIMCSTILQFSFSFSFFLDFLLLLQLRLFSHVFRSI